MSRMKAFLTHNWGKKEDGFANHKRVSEVNKLLKDKNYDCWFDEVAMTGDVSKAMQQGIDNSDCVIIFLTKVYLEKINSVNLADNCFLEFKYTFLKKKPFILVLMDGSVRLSDINDGYAGMHIGDMLYVDMSKSLNVDALVGEMKKKGIHPEAPKVH